MGAREALTTLGHHFIAAKVETGSVPDLPTQTMGGPEATYIFAGSIERTEGVVILRPRYTHI